MTSRTRLWVLLISTPVIAFAIIGGYLGRVLGAGKDDTFKQLPVFEEVVSLVLNNYVEEVDVRHAMRGALKGLTDNLDPDSAYLTPDLVKAAEGGQPSGPAIRSRVSTTSCGSAWLPRNISSFTLLPAAPPRRRAPSKADMSRVGLSLMPRMKSPVRSPALAAGEPSRTETTRK